MPSREGANVSRPSKLTTSTTEAVTAGLTAGLYLDDAARAAGIAPSTLYAWLRRGRAAEVADTPEPGDLEFLEFLEAVEKARAEARRAAVSIILDAARGGTWQAAAWYLERTAPDKYGRGAPPRHPVNAEPRPTAPGERDTDLEAARAAADHTDAVLLASLGMT